QGGATGKGHCRRSSFGRSFAITLSHPTTCPTRRAACGGFVGDSFTASMARWTLEIESAASPRSTRVVDGDTLLVGRGADCNAQLDMILDRVFATLRPEEAAVLRADSDRRLAVSATRPAGLSKDRVFFSHTPLRDVTERRQAALVLDASADARFAAAASIMDSGVRSVLAAPLLTPEGALGMIVLSSRQRVRQFGEDDLQLLVSLAS